MLTEYMEHTGANYKMKIMAYDKYGKLSFVDIAGVCGGLSGAPRVLMFRPAVPLTDYPRRLHKPNPHIVLRIDKRGKAVYGCPVCRKVVRQPDKFCCHCGTMLADVAKTHEICDICVEKKKPERRIVLRHPRRGKLSGGK